MLFGSVTFLFYFLPVVLVLYYLIPAKGKNIVLLVSSLVFYAWGEPVYVVLMLLSVCLNYFCGREIQAREDDPRRAKRSVIFAIVINILVLGFFKYYGFILNIVSDLFSVDIPYRELPLPVGISFYTFQAVSYVIDVYRKKTRAQKNLLLFALYICMFPKLIAGPVMRYEDMEQQLTARKVSFSKIGQGSRYFILGLAKKAILANTAGAVFEQISAGPAASMSALTAWIGCISYAFQIYFDFSGYSDMAIGLGKMFGFEFMKNFDYPYISKSVTEFWRRWHISLGTWFREYVYIPLGGNRVGTKKAIRNIFIVWFLTGFWHGAAWNFIFWGVYYGVLLLLEKYVLKEVLERVPGIIKHIYTMLFVMVGWVLFFSPGMGEALSYIGVMFGIGANGFADAAGIYYLYNYLILFVISIICSAPYAYKKFQQIVFGGAKGRTAVAMGAYMAIFLLSLAYLVNATYNPFLYFRF